MKAYANKWKDFPDYIIGITKEIWEDRGVETLNRYYAKDIPVRSPIFVIGFPRTGTTFLHEMLGLHPAVRMHYTHEQMSYVPTSHEETAVAQRADKAARYARNSKRFDTLIRLAGDNIQHTAYGVQHPASMGRGRR